MPLGDVAAWEREIRGWLLGRLGKGLTTGESPAAEASLAGRALAWWIFEGKRHRFLDGPLDLRTAEAEREARRLDAVLSPEWSVEGGGDRTKAFDAEALRAAALEREEGQDLWLFTSEAEIREALPALA